MIRTVIKPFIFGLVVSLSILSCKSEFERVRTSGDTELIYKQAYAYNESGKFDKAQALFELLIPAYRGKKELEDIYFNYAYTYFYQKKFILASYYFKNFAKTFPNSDYRQESEFMSAYSNYQLSPSYQLDQTNTKQAIEEFQLFINTFPESERVSEANQLIDNCRKKLEKKTFAEGELYFDLRQYQAAILVFENLLKDFPETDNGEQVRFMIVKSSYLLAENSIYARQEERYLSTQKFAEAFLHKYSDGSSYSKQVQNMLDKAVDKLKTFENERYQDKSSGAGS